MVVIMVAPDVIGSIIARLSRHATSTGGPTTRITHALAEGVSALRGGRRWPLRGPGGAVGAPYGGPRHKSPVRTLFGHSSVA